MKERAIAQLRNRPLLILAVPKVAADFSAAYESTGSGLVPNIHPGTH